MDHNSQIPEDEGNFSAVYPQTSGAIPTPPAPSVPPLQGSYYSNQNFHQRQTENNAIISLVCGLVAVFSCQLVGIAAIVIGTKSRKAIRESNGTLDGDGLALTGIILGYVALALIVTCVGFNIFFLFAPLLFAS